MAWVQNAVVDGDQTYEMAALTMAKVSVIEPPPFDSVQFLLKPTGTMIRSNEQHICLLHVTRKAHRYRIDWVLALSRLVHSRST